MARTDPRVFARPFELHRGQALTAAPAGRSAERSRLRAPRRAPSSRASSRSAATRWCSSRATATTRARLVRLVFGGRPPKTRGAGADRHASSCRPRKKTVERDHARPAAHHRARHRPAARSGATCRCRRSRSTMIQAVLAIEDRRFYDHPGIDPIGIAGAVFRNVFGNKAYLRGGSTLTQQLVKNTFLTPEKTPKRKMTEWFMSVVLETRLSKDQILELYLNDVSLGQRGSFAIHGVAEAARLFFAQGHLQRLAGRGGDDRRRHPVAVAAVAVQQSRSAPRSAATSSCARWPTPASSAPTSAERAVARAAADRRARARGRGAVLRRLHQPGAAGEIPGRRHRRRLHDARPPPAADRAGRAARRADPARRDPRAAQAPARAGGAHRRRSAHRRGPRLRRRPLLQPVAVQPRHHARGGSRARSSSRSSTSPRSSTRRPRAGPTSRRRR